MNFLVLVLQLRLTRVAARVRHVTVVKLVHNWVDLRPRRFLPVAGLLALRANADVFLLDVG